MDETAGMMANFMFVNYEETKKKKKERRKYQEEFTRELAIVLSREAGKENGEGVNKALYQISDAMREICKDIFPEKMRFSIHGKRKQDAGGTLKIEIEQVKYKGKMLMDWRMTGGNAPERLEEKMMTREMLQEMEKLKETIQKWLDGEDEKGDVAEAIEGIREIADQLEDQFVIGGEATEETKKEWAKREERSLRLRKERAERRRKALAWIKEGAEFGTNAGT